MRLATPVGEIDQLTPLAHDRVQARAVSWLGSGAHRVAGLPSLAVALTSTTRQLAEV